MLRGLKFFGLGAALGLLALFILAAGNFGQVGGPGLASATQAQPNVEDFETGNFSKFPWQTGGHAPWVITPVSRSGAYGTQAGKIGDSQRSWLQITLTVIQNGNLSFWYKVSSEANGDFLHFFVDGQLQGRWSGEIVWTQATYPITAGSHTLRWEYIKDGSGAAGKDTAYLDDITFPPAITPPQPERMVFIPAGSFQMGDTFGEGSSDERPVHTVFVSAFYMDKYEVTKALWDEVASWAAANGYDIKPADGDGKAPDHPVYNVTWYEVVKWANARSEKEGLTPCYYTDGAQTTVYRTGNVNVRNDWVKWTGCGYRLPTEAEWEKAARGGAVGRRFPWSDTNEIRHARANYYSSADYSYDTSPTREFHPTYKIDPQPYTSPVGSFAPNGYGLYDMAGNVSEWVWDWYFGDYYSSGVNSDPRGPGSGSVRVRRGGSWDFRADFCRVADRNDRSPDFSSLYIGFRAVLPAGQ
jgi:formylglycine-generating enzyme required for sulfatase activity